MKKYLSFIILFFSLQSFGQTYSFTYGGISRNYIVHLPTGYTSSIQYPVVLNLHGYTSNATQQQLYSQMNTVSDTAKFIVVYPNGVNNAWNSGAFGFNSTINDVGFISALIDTLQNKFSVNPNKVYSCGMSLGGFMSYRLACQLSNKIAAIASVTGLMADDVRLNLCQNNCPVPVMDFHGTTDPTVNYNGAAGYASAEATMSWWVAKDGCPSTPVVTNVPNINTADGCTVTKYVYGPGQNSSEVVFFKITGGGHTWPGAFSNGSGNTNQDVKASGEIWNFFKKHTLVCGVNAMDEPSLLNNQISIFPNPSTQNITVKSSIGEMQTIILSNLLGENLKTFAVTNSLSFNLDISDLKNGVYILQIQTETEISFHKIIKQ